MRSSIRRLARLSRLTAALALAGVAAPAQAQPCGTIVGDATDGAVETIVGATVWGGGANPGPICLEEPVFVGGGTAATATDLTIEPGTVVRGQPRRGPLGGVDDNAGTLVVTRFSRILAPGEAAEPIIFTTAAVDNDGDGVCDDGDGDTFVDPHPGFDDVGGCIGAGTCVAPAAPAAAVFCDAAPLVSALSPLDADGGDNVSLWGGVVILGNAPTNLANNAAPGLDLGQGVFEALLLPAVPPALLTYGGPEPNDDSGIFRFASVRHTGDEIAAGLELNGVTLAGVGAGTVYEFVEVYASFDDGQEWFGGTVNADHLLVTYAGDDAFDVDQGYTGNLQFLVAVMPFFRQEGLGLEYGSGSGDAVAELDGVDGDDVRVAGDAADADELARPQPFPAAGIWNLTAIGSTPDGPNPAVNPAAANRGIRMKNGFGGEVVNAIVVNTGPRPCADPDVDGLGDSLPGFLVQDNVDNGLADVRFTTCTTAPAGDAPGEGGNPGGEGNVTAAGAVLVREDPNHDGSSANGVFPEPGMTEVNGYDPRPLEAEAGEAPQEAALDRAAAFRGAFEAAAPELWTTGWTASEIGNVLSR